MIHTGVMSTSVLLASSSLLDACAVSHTKSVANVANAAVECVTDAVEAKREKNHLIVILIENDHFIQKYVNFSIFKTNLTKIMYFYNLIYIF